MTLSALRRHFISQTIAMIDDIFTAFPRLDTDARTMAQIKSANAAFTPRHGGFTLGGKTTNMRPCRLLRTVFKAIEFELDYSLKTPTTLTFPCYTVRLSLYSGMHWASNCGTGFRVTDAHNGTSPYLNALRLSPVVEAA